MGRPATGQLITPDEKQRNFALRFRAYGNREYLTLGRPEDGWTRLRAERELAAVLRDVEHGTWQPRRRQPPQPRQDPLFLEFASDWFARKRFEIKPATARSYRNDLANHLLPFFAEHRLSEITVAEVDRYRQEKVGHARRLADAIKSGTTPTVQIVDSFGRRYTRPVRPLSNRSINMHLFVLEQILEVAVEHELIPTNPAKGKRRRLKVSKPRPVYLDSAEHIQVMLGPHSCSTTTAHHTRAGASPRSRYSRSQAPAPQPAARCWNATSTSPTAASSSPKTRPTPACARSTCSPSCARSSPNTEPRRSRKACQPARMIRC
jgi:hypothetical protein